MPCFPGDTSTSVSKALVSPSFQGLPTGVGFMRRFTSIALSTVSFGALALAVASPASAQDATPDTSTDCAAIADEAAKQACLEKVDSADPL